MLQQSDKWFPGVGLVPVGPLTAHFVAPDGSAEIDLSMLGECFDNNGTLIVSRNSQQYADMFLGGDTSFAWSRPMIGGELEFTLGGAVLMSAFQLGDMDFQGLPFKWEWESLEARARYQGGTTDLERLLFCYCVPMTSRFVQKHYQLIGDPTGKIPTKPFVGGLDLRFTEGRRKDGTYYLYFLAEDQTGGISYWKHGTPTGGATDTVFGYEPGYPAVFDTPTVDTGAVLALEGLKKNIKSRVNGFLASIPSTPAGKPMMEFREKVRAEMAELLKLTA